MKDAVHPILDRLLDKDKETYEHVLRVGTLAHCWTSQLELLEYEEREAFVAGCFIHDIGKILIDTNILQKTSKLDREEWTLMRMHPELGVTLLSIEEIKNPNILDIVMYHHERWDGLGYPQGLQGTNIPKLARMCSIIDAFDAMLSDRPYKKGMSLEEAKAELLAQAGIQFDEMYVKQFLSLPDHLLHHPTLDDLEQMELQGTILMSILPKMGSCL
ncbi:HD-GYP domain-containing protein [Paenibacillus rigui]|uniref:Diguanylate cyclase n=1 Tax=Paenibacillus rigui TaxID=554312 RepID=A0A229UVJ3_9BACL|nr:HD domain-containing phosphohydrolase [Paenibacillus rigui]OXM87301.1 diguanylate cyclase [Paenibacillus rigui]